MSGLPKIVVIGSLNMDMILESSKFPEEGETILGQHFSTAMGGKGANQAIAAARLGAKVSFIGAVGKDNFGEELIDNMKKEGIDTTFISVIENEKTGVACIHLSQSDNRITVIPGANSHLTSQHIDCADNLLKEADLVLLQMEIPLETVEYAIEKVKRMGKKIILNPAPAVKLSGNLLNKVDYLTPNETELSILAYGSNEGQDIDHSAKYLLSLGVKELIVTLGKDGAIYYSNSGKKKNFKPYNVSVVDPTGAGDAFNGGIAYSLARGEKINQAIDLAMKVGALAVTKLGAQAGMPTNEEVEKIYKVV